MAVRLADIPADCPLSRETPYGVAGVSDTQFSVARHYGGCTYNGQHYVYLPLTDELIRHDVLQWLAKKEREQRKAERKAGKALQETPL